MREERVDVPLDGVVLTDVSTGEPVDLGALTGVQVVSLIRHRY